MGSPLARGTRVLIGPEAAAFYRVADALRTVATAASYEPFVPPALAPLAVFTDKAGPEVADQMYTFLDKGGRSLCLAPEVTAICQALYRAEWAQARPKPVRLWYLARCYRYERPQAGRYREFWQFGVEALGGTVARADVVDLLERCLTAAGLRGFELRPQVRRGLAYYVEDGFEVECPWLGAQKQVAGGGRYAEGIGWAIGVDRLLLALAPRTDGA